MEAEPMKTTSACQCGFVVLMAAITISGCGGGGSSSGGSTSTTQQITQLPVEKYAASGVLTNPSGAPLPGTVTLTATDVNGTAVSLYSDKTGGTQITTVIVDASGLISFYVADTAALPVSVKAVATSPGLVSSSIMFTVTKSGTSYFSIQLVNPALNTTAGVFSGTTIGAASGAVVGELDTDVATDSNPDPVLDPEKTAGHVLLPAKSVLTDGAGSPLSGQVTTTVTTFAPPVGYGLDPVKDDAILSGALAMENFPGSLGNAQVAAASAKTLAGQGYFVTAGFVAVNAVDASGKQAKHSSTPFNIRLDIPAGTISQTTNLPLVAGDVIPVWTYSDTDPTWKAEVDTIGDQVLGLVKQDAKGLYVDHTTNHFSFWNLGWFFGTRCSATLNLTGDAILLPLTLKATLSTGAGLLINGFKPSGDATVTASNVPSGKNIDLVLIDSSKKIIASKKAFNWCAGPITLGYTAPAAQKPVPVTVTVSEYCAQNPAITRNVPSAITIVSTPPIALISSGTTDINGAFIHYLTPGTFDFSVFDRTAIAFKFQRNVPVVAGTPKIVAFKFPVQCKPISGATTGTTGYSF